MHSEKVSETSVGSRERASASSTETRKVKLTGSLRSPPRSSVSRWMSSSLWIRHPPRLPNKRPARSLLLLPSPLIQWGLDWYRAVSYTHLRAHETRHDI